MRVLISGQAGLAAVIDDHTASLHSVDRFSDPTTIGRNRLHQFLADATDVIEVETDDLVQVEKELRLRWRKDRALHLTLMALEAEDADHRQHLIDTAETLLAEDSVADFVESRLHRHPLPDPDAAVRLVDAASLRHCLRLVTVLRQVLDGQHVIAKFDAEWTALPTHLFGTGARKLRLRRRLDEAGLWHRMVRLRWTHEWHAIASAIESDTRLGEDASVLHQVLPELLYSCRQIHVSWPAADAAIAAAIADAAAWTKTNRADRPKVGTYALPSISCLYDAERLLVRYARRFDREPADDHLRDANAVLLLTHHWQDRKNEDLRRSWAARDTKPLNLWLEKLAEVSPTCPLHVVVSGDFTHGFTRGRTEKTGTLRELLKQRLRKIVGDGNARRDAYIVEIGDDDFFKPLSPPLAHAWHASIDLKLTSCRDVAGLRWMEHVLSAMPGTDSEATAGFLRHPEMIEELLLDSPKTQWEWAASHALRVLALRNHELDLLERLPAACTLSAHAVAVAQLYRAEWKRGVEALEPINDPVADVLRIHAYGALRSVDHAREAYDRARDATAPALSFARETLYNRFIRGEANVPDRWLYEREVDMLAEAA